MAITEEGLILIPGLQSRWVRLPTGARAHYVTAGETGPYVVLCHGAMAGASGTAGWRFMAPFLGANGFRVFCPDMPGFGINEGVAEAYLPASAAYDDPRRRAGVVDFLHDFVSSLCLDRFHIGGNSQGNLAAMNYTVAHPDRIISFAGIGSAGDLQGVVSMEEVLKANPRRASGTPYLRFDGTEESMRALVEVLVYDKSTVDDELVTMRTLAARKSGGNFAAGPASEQDAAVIHNTNIRLSLKDRFGRLELPIIYACGLQDVSATPEVYQLQEDALPNTQVFYVDQCGHQAQSDQPEIINQLFLEFLRDGVVSRATAERAGVSTRRPTLPVVAAH